MEPEEQREREKITLTMRVTPAPSKIALKEAFSRGEAAGGLVSALRLVMALTIAHNIVGQQGMVEQIQQHWWPWYADSPIVIVLWIAGELYLAHQRSR